MKHLLSNLLKAAILVGTLDILSAFIYVFIKTGTFVPFNILQFIASGIWGKKAASGGTTMIVAGLLLHYFIAFSFTLFFFWLFPKLKAASKNKILTGVVYGMFIWVVMNLIILPLSNIAYRPFSIVNAIINVLILIACVGIPLSFMASVFYNKVQKPMA